MENLNASDSGFTKNNYLDSPPVVSCVTLNHCVLISPKLKMKVSKLHAALLQAELRGQEESWKLQDDVENQFVCVEIRTNWMEFMLSLLKL